MITEMICRKDIFRKWYYPVSENLQDIRFNSPGYKLLPHWNHKHVYDNRTKLRKVVQRYMREENNDYRNDV